MAARELLNGEPGSSTPANKYLLIRYFLGLSLISASVAAIIHLQQAYYYIATTELLLSILILYFLFIHRNNHGFVLLIPIVTILIYILFVTGSISQQDSLISLVWVPVYPFIYFYLTDHRTGLFWSVVSLLTFITGYLIHPYFFLTERIPLTALVQTVSSYIFVSALAYFYELVRHRQEVHLQMQANYDYLTNIYNRRGLSHQLDIELNRAERYGTRLSFMLIDMDNFKQVNDTYGHTAGDTLLQEISELTQHSIRKSDVVARWGGEEFAILLPEADITQAQQLAEKLRSIVASHHFETVGTVTISIGVTQYQLIESLDDLLYRADTALYRAKELGKNRVEVDMPVLDAK